MWGHFVSFDPPCSLSRCSPFRMISESGVRRVFVRNRDGRPDQWVQLTRPSLVLVPGRMHGVGPRLLCFKYASSNCKYLSTFTISTWYSFSYECVTKPITVPQQAEYKRADPLPTTITWSAWLATINDYIKFLEAQSFGIARAYNQLRKVIMGCGVGC